MKKIILALFVLAFALSANLTVVTDLDYSASYGYDFYQLEFKGTELTANETADLYLYNIAGYDSVGYYIDGTTVSTADYATINMQPMLSNRVEIGTAQILTDGSDLTDLRSAHYKMTITNWASVTNNVTMNILIAK